MSLHLLKPSLCLSNRLAATKIPRRRAQLCCAAVQGFSDIPSPAETCPTGNASRPTSWQPQFATMTRFLWTLVPTNTLSGQMALRRMPALPSPVAVLCFIYALLAAVVAAVRSRIESNVRRCRCCRGYGIERCRVCQGQGVVVWNAKASSTQPCPLCHTARYTPCLKCGGRFTRTLFRHVKGMKPDTRRVVNSMLDNTGEAQGDGAPPGFGRAAPSGIW